MPWLPAHRQTIFRYELVDVCTGLPRDTRAGLDLVGWDATMTPWIVMGIAVLIGIVILLVAGSRK